MFDCGPLSCFYHPQKLFHVGGVTRVGGSEGAHRMGVRVCMVGEGEGVHGGGG